MFETLPESLRVALNGMYVPDVYPTVASIIDGSRRRVNATASNMDSGNVTVDTLGRAFTFNGTDEFYTSSPGFDVTEYTLSALVKPSATGTAKSIIVHTSGVPTSAWSAQIRHSSTVFQSYVFDTDRRTVSDTDNFAANTWYHVVGTAKSGDFLRLYVDGREKGTAVALGTIVAGQTSRRIAEQSGDGYGFFAGSIGPVLIWNRALSAGEVRQLYQWNMTRAWLTRPKKVVVRGASINSYSLTADVASFTLSGQSASVLKAFTVTGEAGTFSVSGQDAQLEKGFLVAGEVGSFSETGQAANLLKGYTTTFDVGAFNETGQDANLLASRQINIDAGTFSVSGQDATLTKTSANSLAADATSFALVGQDATLRVARLLVGDAASFVFTGQGADLAKGRTLTADAGSFNVSGQDALLRRTARLAIDAASFTLTGQNAQLTFAGGGLVPAPYYYQMMMGG